TVRPAPVQIQERNERQQDGRVGTVERSALALVQRQEPAARLLIGQGEGHQIRDLRETGSPTGRVWLVAQQRCGRQKIGALEQDARQLPAFLVGQERLALAVDRFVCFGRDPDEG